MTLRDLVAAMRRDLAQLDAFALSGELTPERYSFLHGRLLEGLRSAQDWLDGFDIGSGLGVEPGLELTELSKSAVLPAEPDRQPILRVKHLGVIQGGRA